VAFGTVTAGLSGCFFLFPAAALRQRAVLTDLRKSAGAPVSTSRRGVLKKERTMNKNHQKKHPLEQATTRSSTKLATRNSASKKQPNYSLYQVLIGGRLVIVADEQLFPNDPDGIVLQPSIRFKTTTARCWIEAKKKMGFRLTDLQAFMLDERFGLAA